MLLQSIENKPDFKELKKVYDKFFFDGSYGLRRDLCKRHEVVRCQCCSHNAWTLADK